MFKLLLLLLTVNSAFAANTSVFWDNYFFSLNPTIITLPEYIATYLITIGAYFFTIIIIFEIIMVSYKYISAGFNFQQMRPVILNFISTIIIVMSILFAPGVKSMTFNGEQVRTKILVDMVSAFFASGSRIADFFVYELMFGSGYTIKNGLFDLITEGPTKDSELKGFVFQTAISSLYNIQTNEKIAIEKQKQLDVDFRKGLAEFYKQDNLKEYYDLNEEIKSLEKSLENGKIFDQQKLDMGEGKMNEYFRFTTNDKDGNPEVIEEVAYNVSKDNINSSESVKNAENLFNKKLKDNIKGKIDEIIENNDKIYTKIEKDIDRFFLHDDLMNNANYEVLKFKNILKDYKKKFNDIELIKAITLEDNEDNNKLFKNIYVDSKMQNSENNFNEAIKNNFKELLFDINKQIQELNNKNIIKEPSYETNLNRFSGDISNSLDGKMPENEKIAEAFAERSKKLKEEENSINEQLKTLVNNSKTMISGKTLSLNDLYHKSNFLNNLVIFETIIIGDEKQVVNQLVENINLADDYQFHWYDLGNYFTGIKFLMSNNLINQMALNDIIINTKDGNYQESIEECYNNGDRNPNCSPQSFNYTQASTDIINATMLYLSASAIYEQGKNLSTIYKNNKTDAAKADKNNFKNSKGLKKAISLKDSMGTFLNGTSSQATKSLVFGIIKVCFILFFILVMGYSIIPILFWYVGLVNWFFKSSVMLVTFCFTFVFLVMDNKRQQIINNVFLLIGQAIIPMFLVGFFFLVVHMSVILDITIYNAIPLGNLIEGLEKSSIFGEGESFASLGGMIPFVLRTVLNGVLLVILLVINISLFRYFWQVDEFVSEAIGTRVSNTAVRAEKVIQNFTSIGGMGNMV